MSHPWHPARLRAVRGLVVALIAVGTCAAAASAAPTPTPMNDALTTYWDGPTLNLNWRGNTYTTVSGTFVGYPISVPGDAAWRTLKIRNDGPCDGNLTIDVFDVMAEYPESTINSELPDIINLGWEIFGTQTKKTFASIIAAGGSERIAEVPLARSAEIPLIMGYEFPYDETRGRNLGFPSTALTFMVRITITGDETCISPSPGPNQSSATQSPPSQSGGPGTPPPLTGSASPSLGQPSESPKTGGASPGPRPNLDTETPGRSGTAVAPSPGPDTDRLPETGTAIASIALASAILLLLGLAARRRRNRDMA